MVVDAPEEFTPELVAFLARNFVREVKKYFGFILVRGQIKKPFTFLTYHFYLAIRATFIKKKRRNKISWFKRVFHSIYVYKDFNAKRILYEFGWSWKGASTT